MTYTSTSRQSPCNRTDSRTGGIDKWTCADHHCNHPLLPTEYHSFLTKRKSWLVSEPKVLAIFQLVFCSLAWGMPDSGPLRGTHQSLVHHHHQSPILTIA